MHLRVIRARLDVLQAADGERPRLLLVAYAAGLLPQSDGADVELLDVVDGADGELPFFGDRQAAKISNHWHLSKSSIISLRARQKKKN